MDFSTETRVGQIALANPASRRILEDAGIDYCCGGGKSLREACMHADVPAEEILNRLQQQSESAGPEEAQWAAAPLADLTRHIQDHHHQYVRDSIPRIRTLLSKVRERHAANHPEIGRIEGLFSEVAREMLMHMQKEEHVLFPYIDAVERSANGNGPLEPPFFQTVKNPIHMMMREHDAAGELVRQIRVASSEYKPPTDACTTFRATYQELQQFEEDLHLHVHLENNILFPRAVELEARVL
jgi:regulator of cell morphogenesis and NO signaling